MNSLDISEATAKKLESAESKALDVINDFLGGTIDYDDRVKVAMQTNSVVAKNRVSMTARMGLGFNMVKSITEDPKILKKYVNATTPIIGKLLPGK